MKAIDYFDYLVNRIHTTIVATIDENGYPVTSAIDMMDYDDSGIYFLTAKGKNFYQRLKNEPHMSLTGLKGETTMTSVALSIQGEVKEVGENYLPQLFEKNPYMYDIYPTESSRCALTVFKIYKGKGEWFDLSRHPIERAQFTFGHETIEEEGYFIIDRCIGCGQCFSVCPQMCIDKTNIPFTINQNNCLRCGNCLTICPSNAVVRK